MGSTRFLARRGAIVAIAVAVGASVGGCSEGGGASGNPTDGGAPTDLTGTPSGALPQGGEPFELDPAGFTVDIDNPWWPMEPGTRWTYREVEPDGTQLEVVVVVTQQTRLIANGVTARVIRDTVTEDGEIVEDTLDWYAQDADGNVWYLGEDTAEFDGGAVTTTAGSWEAGVDGALAGVIMPADPTVGMAYRQEYYAGEAEDNGAVIALGEVVEVPWGSFDDTVVTEDTSALQASVLEHKYYVRGIGPVLAVDVNGGGREELVTVDQAPPDAGIGPLGSPNP